MRDYSPANATPHPSSSCILIRKVHAVFIQQEHPDTILIWAGEGQVQIKICTICSKYETNSSSLDDFVQ